MPRIPKVLAELWVNLRIHIAVQGAVAVVIVIRMRLDRLHIVVAESAYLNLADLRYLCCTILRLLRYCVGLAESVSYHVMFFVFVQINPLVKCEAGGLFCAGNYAALLSFGFLLIGGRQRRSLLALVRLALRQFGRLEESVGE